jgi:hypothetical protein
MEDAKMSVSESVTGPMPEGGGHEDKKEKICSVMRECCSGMSAAEKKTVMRDVMPHMMDTMGDNSMRSTMGMMMGHCMRAFRWLPLIPLGFGIVFFLIGYFLSAEAVRILWLVLAAIPIILGTLALLITSAMSR